MSGVGDRDGGPPFEFYAEIVLATTCQARLQSVVQTYSEDS